MPSSLREVKWPAWTGPVASAILLALAFAGLWPLTFVALIPWLLSLRGATPRQAWNRGYAFGFLFSLTQLWWLGDLAYKWTANPILGILPWLLASLLSAVYYGLLGRLVRSCSLIGAVGSIPLVWAGMEVFRSYIPVLAFPWALLAEPVVGTPLRGLAWFGTIYLASAFVAAINVGLAYRRHAPLVSLTSVAALAIVGWTFWSRRDEVETAAGQATVNVGAGQPGIDMAFDADANLKVGPAVEAVASAAARSGVGILVLPEGIAQGGDTIPPKTPFRIPASPALVFGGQRGLGPVYQSAFSVDDGRWSFADKTRLVIFGEFVPGRDYFPFLQNAFHLPGGDLSAGNKLGQLQVGRWRVGPIICFEELFPDLALRQAWLKPDFLAVMSIDDWFALPARERLASAARWRAVEAGALVVRAGSLGRTMIVDPSGEVTAEAPYGKRWLAVAALRKGRGPFPLVWLFPAIAFGALLAVPFLARRKNAAPPAEAPEKEPNGDGDAAPAR